MKVCAYVQSAYAKKTYKNECMDTRQFVGLRIVINELEKAGIPVEYAGIATVHEYNVVLVSLTAQCDWYSFVSERMCWKSGHYKVAVGGAGVLNVEPFLEFFDVAMIGRGEDLIVPVVKGLLSGEKFNHTPTSLPRMVTGRLTRPIQAMRMVYSYTKANRGLRGK